MSLLNCHFEQREKSVSIFCHSERSRGILYVYSCNLNQAFLPKHFQPWELYLPIVSIQLWCPHGREASSSRFALCQLPALLRRAAYRHRNPPRRSTQRLGSYSI